MTSRPPFRISRAFLPALAAGLVLGLGCRRDEVTRTAVDKAPAAPMTPMPPMAPAGQGPASPAMLPPPASPQVPLKWSLPKGWTESAGSGMRLATLTPPASGGKAEVSVTVLSGAAGGELANVNRWRGQLGLGPIDEKTLAATRRTTAAKAGRVVIHDITSEGQVKSRTVVGFLATADGNTWFLKLQGEAGAVDKAKAGFLGLLGTLRLD